MKWCANSPKSALLFQPGTPWSYSSAGIEILGRIIEVCSGQKYEDFIAERILRPLGMKDSFFYPPADKIDRIAMVYGGKDGKLVRAPGTILGGDPGQAPRGRRLSRPRLGTLFHRRRPAASLSHDAERRRLRRPPLSFAFLRSPDDRGAHHRNSPRGLDARLGLRPGLGSGHRSDGRTGRPRHSAATATAARSAPRAGSTPPTSSSPSCSSSAPTAAPKA